jgi:hypothetical protein
LRQADTKTLSKSTICLKLEKISGTIWQLQQLFYLNIESSKVQPNHLEILSISGYVTQLKMDPLPLRPTKGPEQKIKEAIVSFLKDRGWYVLVTHGSMYQSGFPDLYATHPVYKARWIEVKLPDMKGSKFTKAQLKIFPEMSKNGSPIWILTGATENEYKKLFLPENYWQYMLEKS